MLNMSLIKLFAENMEESIKSSEHLLRKYENIKPKLYSDFSFYLKNIFVVLNIYIFRKYLLNIANSKAKYYFLSNSTCLYVIACIFYIHSLELILWMGLIL